MIDTSPWSPWSTWLPCFGHTISSTGPSVSPFRDFFYQISPPHSDFLFFFLLFLKIKYKTKVNMASNWLMISPLHASQVQWNSEFVLGFVSKQEASSSTQHQDPHLAFEQFRKFWKFILIIFTILQITIQECDCSEKLKYYLILLVNSFIIYLNNIIHYFQMIFSSAPY